MTKRVFHYTVAEAEDFFERLGVYGAEYVRVAIPQIHRHWPSKNSYDEWRYEHPLGHVLHFTAGVRFAGTIRHFVLQHRASTNWVISKALDRRFDEFRQSLDLDTDLRAECVQVVPPERPSWHSGWVNRFLAGTEVRNAGILRPNVRGRAIHPGRVSREDFFRFAEYDVDDLDFYWWPDGWTTEFHGEVVRIRTPNGVSFWESWSRGSVATVITVLRYFNSLYPGKLQPEWFLAHHNLNPGKNDIVLPLDLHGIRDAVLFSNEHVDDVEWLAELDDVEDGFEDEDEPWMLREMDRRQADRAEEDVDDFDPRKIEGRLDTPAETEEALHRLGYCFGGAEADPGMLRTAIRTYQRSRGLSVDGNAGPETNGRLDRELKSWRLR